MNRLFNTIVCIIILSTLVTYAQSAYPSNVNEFKVANIDVWLDKNDGAIYHTGENLEIYFRASADCYAVIYDIDTEGRTRILFPQFPDDGFILGNRTYRLPDYYDQFSLRVDGRRGVEYIQAVTTTQSHVLRYEYNHNSYRLGLDFITGDPFESINQINDRLIDPSYMHGSATTYFFVEGYVWYPRYLCAGCHSNSYAHFDPYTDVCPRYQIITVHNHDYWWGADYFPIRIGFRFGNPFWKWEIRTGNFYRPYRTRGFFEIAFGCTNFYTPIIPRHAYIDRESTDYRYRRYEQYQREYQPNQTRYRSRISGSTRSAPDYSTRARSTNDERSRNNFNYNRRTDTPIQRNENNLRDRSFESRSDSRQDIQINRDRNVNRNIDVNPGIQRSSQREQNEANVSRDRIKLNTPYREPQVRPNMERSRIQSDNNNSMIQRSAPTQIQSTITNGGNRSNQREIQTEKNENVRSRGR